MTEPKEGRRAQLGLKARCDEISNYLSKRYVMLNPGKTRMNFVTELCHCVHVRDDPTVDHPRDLINLLLQSNDPTVPLEQQSYDPMVPVVLSVTFLLRAMDAEAQGQHERGWNYLVEATYWCGLAQGGRHIDLVQAEAASDARKETAKKAATRRHGVDRKTKEFAQQRARDLCPDGGWRPRIAAARKIEAEVVQFAKKHGWTMMSRRETEQIDQWLSQMADANQIFPTQKKKSQSPQ